MLENSLIYFSDKKDTCGSPKPIYSGEKFLLPEGAYYAYIYKEDDTYYSSCSVYKYRYGEQEHYYATFYNSSTKPICIYIMAGGLYSQMLQLMPSTDGISKIQYQCNEDAFGFPFSAIKSDPPLLTSYLPILLKNPQLKQEDKTYVKANGEVVVLYSKMYKEWELETDYIPIELHERIVVALSCDDVYIDDIRVTKSDSYEIDWGNTIKKACGQKLAKATCKVRANVMERNSNC